MEQGPRGSSGAVPTQAQRLQVRAQHTHRGTTPLPRLDSPSGRDPPTGKAGGGGHWGQWGRRGQAVRGAALQGPAQPQGSGPAGGSRAGAGVGAQLRHRPGSRVRLRLCLLREGPAGHCGPERAARFRGPRGTAAPPRRPWHRAPSSSNRKSLTTGRPIDPPIPPASGRQERPDRQASRRRAAGEPPGAPAR